MQKISRVHAKLAIAVQFAPLLRCLGEYFRVQWLEPAATLTRISPFIFGALVSAIGLLVAVLFYFAEKWLFTVATAAVTILTLLVLRFTLL